MALFINHHQHPDVYKNPTAISAINQANSQTDTFSEWMREQQEANDSINEQLNLLETLMDQQKMTHSKQLQAIRKRLFALQERANRQERFEKDVLQSVSKLEVNQHSLQQMSVDERSLNQERSMEVQEMRESTKAIVNRLELFAAVDEELAGKLNEQFIHQQALSEQLSTQQDAQQVVVSRLDDQQGLMDKMLKQVDQLRIALYERTNVLTKKMEDSYSMTSSYLAKLLPGPEQPLARFLLNQKQEEKRENAD